MDDPKKPSLRINLEGFARDHVFGQTTGRMREALDRALRDEQDRVIAEVFGRRPGTTYSTGKAGDGPTRSSTPWDDPEVREAFYRARDFGRWSDKVSEPIWEGGTPCQAFATPTRSIFGSAAYLAVSEEPDVAVAAAQLRADRENVRGGSFSAADREVLCAGSLAKLKRRIRAANHRRETQP